jgi:hypothetical protein
MRESGNLRRSVTDCPNGCTCPHLKPSEGVDRLLRTEFSVTSLQPSRVLRQRLRQRIAREDSLWRPLERLEGSRVESSTKFLTLRYQGPGSSRLAGVDSKYLPERRGDRRGTC